jgi:ABC-type lipoprotein export system ATPase subunit
MNPEGHSILKAVQLSKTFQSAAGPIEVLRSVSLEVAAGESLSIRGASGSGKSTLLNVLSGLEFPDSGELFWNEEPVSRSRVGTRPIESARAERIGFVFQSYYLVPELNAFENVLLGARVRGRVNGNKRERVRSLLDRVGLKDRERQNPLQMSGGERQRIAIARALINEPEMILADEPTGNLDERTGEAVMELLLEVMSEERSSLILVTHNREYAGRTDRRF